KPEHAGVKPGLLEALRFPEIEISANVLLAHVDPMRQHACREFRAPGLAGRLPVIVAYEIAIEIERYPGHLGYGVLECRVAAGILPRVEGGEAIKWPRVGGRVIEQMGDSEIHATAAGGHLVANRSRKRIGVRLGRGEGLG